MKPTKQTEDTAAAEAPPTAIYEVLCHEIEIDALICYRTHRLALTKERADQINSFQPGSVKLAGI